MLEKIRQKWVEWLVAFVLIVVTSILTNSYNMKRDASNSFKTQFEKKADKDYVDKQDDQIRETIKSGDENIKYYFEQYTEQQMLWQKSQDEKMNILLSRTK